MKWRSYKLMVLTLALTAGVLPVFQNCSKVEFAPVPGADLKNGALDQPSNGDPVNGRITINAGALYTNDIAVRLGIESQGAQEMYITGASDCSKDGFWEPFNEQRAWSLDHIDSLNHVYAKFRQKNGPESECVTASITHDGKAPLPSFVSGPREFSNALDADFSIKADDDLSGVKELQCRLDTADFKKCDDRFTLTDVPVGPRKVQIRAVDQAGNMSDPVDYPWLIDRTAPTISILDPKPPKTAVIANATFRFEAQDGTGSGIGAIYCQLDNQAAKVCTSPETLSGIPDGSHVFQVWAVDLAGNSSPKALYDWRVDTEPSGNFEILGVTGGNDLDKDAYLGTTPTPTLHWTASSGAVRYIAAILNSAGTSPVCEDHETANTSVTFSGCNLQHGTKYMAKVVAFDDANLEKAAPLFSFVVDTVAPAMSIQTPIVSLDQLTTTINFSVSDTVSGVKEALCMRTFSGVTETLPCTGKTSMVFNSLAPGEHIFQIKSRDVASNEGLSSEVKFLIRKQGQVEQNVTVEAPPTQVDVLVVVDTSGSMANERKELGSRLAEFTNQLGSLDWRICVTTTAAGGALQPFSSGLYALTKSTPNYNTLFLNKVTSLTEGSGDEQGIANTVLAVQNNDARCFRPDAALSVVLLSDEDERSTGGWEQYASHNQYRPLGTINLPATAVSEVKRVFGDQKVFTFHSLVVRSTDTACYDLQSKEAPVFYGTRYEELSRMTGGIIGNICSANYGNELREFATKIQRTLDAITLQCIPDGAPQVTVTPAPAGLTYTVDGNKLKFTPSLPSGTQVNLKYFCKE